MESDVKSPACTICANSRCGGSENPGAAERFDHDYLLAVVDKDLFWLGKGEVPFSNPAWYMEKIDPDMY